VMRESRTRQSASIILSRTNNNSTKLRKASPLVAGALTFRTG
jgi:hypothetical protein